MMEPKQFPRPCEVRSHQFYMEGLCLEIKDGYALVEGKDGGVSRFNLHYIYEINFTDR